MTPGQAYKYYTGEIGISPEEFYSSTPAELHLKAEGYLESVKNKAELASYVTAIGVHNAMSKKKVKLFKNATENHGISKDKKKEDLKYLKDKFKE